MDYNFSKLRDGLKNNNFKLIGLGSSRRVYDLNNGFVAKVARDIRGIMQNEAEYKIHLSSKSNFFAEITAISDNFKYLIMPKAKKINNINVILRYYKVRSIKALVKSSELLADIKTNQISYGDLRRAANWGIIDNVPLIIDYGLTQSIYKKYYKNRLFFNRFKPLQYSS